MYIEPILILGGLGLGFGAALAIASKQFKVTKDPREDKIIAALPGNNCGACGLSGCSTFAKALLSGEIGVASCVVGSEDMANKLGEILDKEPEKIEKHVAKVLCLGDCNKTTKRGNYKGIKTCKAATLASGGNKSCSYGCLGYGDCVKACPVNTISIIHGIAVVDTEKCISCRKCVYECPKDLIEMVPVKTKVHVLCKSNDSAKDTMSVCKIGCFACKICEQECPFDAIHVTDSLAKIDYTKCTNCGICATKCPRKIIINENNKIKVEDK